MALEKSEAIILKMFNWSESSRTVHFFSRDFGRIALVDKAGRSFKSKRGRLMPFARMELTFYKSEKQTSGYISDCEILEVFSFEADGTLGRLAYGSAACELLYLLLPEEEAQTVLYEYSLSYLRYVDRVNKRFLPSLFLAFFLRLISQLGYHPSLGYCVVSGTDVARFESEAATVAFSPQRGGVVSAACQKPGEYYIDLTSAGLKSLLALQQASLSEASAMPIGYQDAVRLVEALTEFLAYQADIRSELKSLAFLEKLNKSQLHG